MSVNWQEWTLHRLRGLVERFEHLEESMAELLDNDDLATRLEHMRSFAPSSDFENVVALMDPSASRPEDLPFLVLQRLSPYFEGGLLAQRSDPTADWMLTALISRGQHFALSPSERPTLSQLIQPLQPQQVLMAPATALVGEIPVRLPSWSTTAKAFLLMPTPVTSYILISDIPPLWREDHVRRTLNLVNRAFNP